MLQPSLKSITSCSYFIIISVADFVVVVLMSLNSVIRQLSFGSTDLALLMSCLPFKFLTYTFGYISSLSLAFVNIERAIAVCKPLFALHWLTPKKTRVCITGIIIFSVALGSNILFLYEATEVNGKPQCSVNNARYPAYASLFFSIEPIFFSTIPLTIIIGSNSLILFKLLHRRISGHHSAAKGTPNIQSAKESKENDAFEKQTRKVLPMLLIVSFAFILCTGPLSVLVMIRFSSLRHLLLVDLQGPYVCHMFTGVAVVLSLNFMNHAINFYMYVISGEKFRKELQNVFAHCTGKCKEPRTPTASMSTVNAITQSSSFETGPQI